ncbi:MAG: outer membrane protein assembly factor BamE [Alphaproteobacteria bacterium]|nr:outer membrane protein assembly factor BamE [Alphaproteobacteria bacterium]MBE8220902.1 outer membrane protein assembly factor BamE [Alphaproteobacteria bacterium]
MKYNKYTKHLCAVALATSLAACTPVVDYRGYVFEPSRLAQVENGTDRLEVIALLGVPSSQSAIDNRTIYYIYSRYETHTLFSPDEKERRIMAIEFDGNDKVTAINKYGLDDGIIVAYSDEETQTQGSTLSALRQILGNFGRFGSGGDL